MRLHLLSLPHTQVTKDYSACAYTQKVRKFADMMVDRGHEVFIYGSEDNDSKGTLIPCITKQQQSELGFDGPDDYLKIDFNPDMLIWHIFNKNAIEELRKNLQPRDLILVSMGHSQSTVVNSFPDHISVEYGIGYKGVLPNTHHVFESHAWRNFVYGKYDWDGKFFDEVIPNYFDIEDFPNSEPYFPYDNKGKVIVKDPYFLFCARITQLKGYQIAIDVCEKLGKKLIMCGKKDDNVKLPDWVEYRGVVGPKERGELMAGALGLFSPTLYIGPFEGVSVEAQLCGTPVIATPWGSYVENLTYGAFLCSNMSEFVEAATKLQNPYYWRRSDIRQLARRTFSKETIAKQYEEYFERLLTLWDKGFYA